MARRRVGGAVRGRAPRRETVWFEFGPALDTVAAASTSSLIFSLNAAALALRPFTVVRTRGTLFYRSDQVIAGERYGGNFGIAVVSDQASAVGVTAIPTPITDFGSDLWFVMEQMQGSLHVATAVGELELGFHIALDSKAMRRVDIGQDIVVVQETAAYHLSNALEVGFRMLVKLH